MDFEGLDRDRWERLSGILDGAIGLSPEALRGYLDRSCAGDAALRAMVEAIHSADRESRGILDDPPTLARSMSLEPAEDGPGAEAGTLPVGHDVGAFRVLKELGRGGMGVVYLAERADHSFEQRVAIKVIKRGLDTDEVLARFVQERRILARLDHPNIARLIDGGVTADGRPFFAMEYVDGKPLTAHCAQQRASIPEILHLMVHVCRAVQFAHERFIVHRDLKPSNILVTAAGEVKLLDFGIAKLLDLPVGEPTQAASIRFTPHYAAPEQWTGEPASAATDVFSLGVILYELLTGDVPGRARAEPGARHASGAKRVSGDLDRIALHAMHPEPGRRYPSAAALLDDIERFLLGRPVRATRPTLAYRARRFVGRNRVGVGVGAVALLSLLVGLAATTWQARVAARERDRARAETGKAETINRFMLELFRSIDPDSTKGRNITARELLDQGVARIDVELKRQPGVEAPLRSAMGALYKQISALDRATAMFERALALQEELTGPKSLETAAALADLGSVLSDRGDYPKALDLLQRAESIQSARLGSKHPDVARTMSAIATTYQAMGRYADAERLRRQALAIVERAYGPDHPRVADELDKMGALFYAERRVLDSAPLHERALAIRLRTSGRDNLATATAMENVANLAGETGNVARAESLHIEALGIVRRLYGPDHYLAIDMLKNLAGHYLARTYWERAEPPATEALRIARLNYGPGHPRTAHIESNVGSLEASFGRFARAESLILDAQRIWSRTLGPDYVLALHSRTGLGEIYLEEGRVPEAEKLIAETHERMVRILGAENFQIGYSLMSRGRLRMAQGRYREAEADFRRALELWERTFGKENFHNGEAVTELAGALYEEGKVDSARALYQRAVRMFESQLERGAYPATDAYVGWGRSLTRLGSYAEADSVLRIAHAARWMNPHQWPARLAEVDAALGVCLALMDSTETARALLSRSAPALRHDFIAPRSLVRDASRQRARLASRR
jgi:tetratricopeptide (TPR) repeat protein/predicted Ser/Thr protein kinase